MGPGARGGGGGASALLAGWRKGVQAGALATQARRPAGWLARACVCACTPLPPPRGGAGGRRQAQTLSRQQALVRKMDAPTLPCSLVRLAGCQWRVFVPMCPPPPTLPYPALHCAGHPVFETAFGRIAVNICYGRHHPMNWQVGRQAGCMARGTPHRRVRLHRYAAQRGCVLCNFLLEPLLDPTSTHALHEEGFHWRSAGRDVRWCAHNAPSPF